MDRLLQRLLLLCILLANTSCQEKEPSLPVDPEPMGYTQYGSPFGNVPAAADVVMYEVNLRAFSEAGTLKGVRERLDYLQDLGVNVIWLMPIHPIGKVKSVNSPYSVQDHKAVSPEYGSLADLRALTDAAHSRNMAVILDWVGNHTSWDHPWISNRSWYTQDASGEIVHPAGTNWEDVADLNYDNTEMREAMIDAMQYWILEANVDGYRCDYADGIPFDFWQQALDSLRQIPNRAYVFLAEGSRLDHWTAGFDLIYAWDFYNSLKTVFGGQPATILYNTHRIEYSGVPDGKHKLRYSTNHDESAWDATPMVLYHGAEGAVAASVITIFLGGTPLIYTAQEVGRTATLPFFTNTQVDWAQHPAMLEAYQAMLEFYRESAVARQGVNTNYSNADVVCFHKELAGETLLVMVNVRNEAVDFPIPPDFQNTTWTDAFSMGDITLSNTVALGAYAHRILKK